MDHEQIEQKQKYAAWKAADIRKAIKEGRKPTPGDPVDDETDLSIPSSGPSGSYVSFLYLAINDFGASRCILSNNIEQCVE